jgi:hypothetical protein
MFNNKEVEVGENRIYRGKVDAAGGTSDCVDKGQGSRKHYLYTVEVSWYS